MVIAGIDPGSRTTGFGVVTLNGNRVKCLDYGVIVGSPSKKAPQQLHHRLARIYSELTALLSKHEPDVVVVEDVFHAANANSALKLGQARGVILLAAAQSGAEVFRYTPLEVKKAVVGYGRAHKDQIKMMVTRLLNLPGEPSSHDAADALAIALCHAFRPNFSKKASA